MGMNPRGRSRGRNHNNFNNNRRFNNGPNRNTVYDSIGPAGRLRGTAFQLMEKYLSAAKELMSSDRVAAESCLQHADHYMRINALAIAAEGMRFAPQPQTEPETVENVEEAEDQSDESNPVVISLPEPVAEEKKEPNLSEVVKMDLSVPVSAIAENEVKTRRGRPAAKKEPQPSEGNIPVVVKRRGRPSKKTVDAEA
ncbi:MAG: DUF4167 domain-containing protein [Alphaproteobacteria bacterium]|nr:DUF4167 domain-containing protein [Alphaproteobacteria bacterium]